MLAPRGFTLIEAAIASAVLAMAVLAIAASLNAGHMAGYEFAQGRRATRLAEELAEFILSLPYYDPDGASAPGPEPGESSFGLYDNADDFHGYVEAGAALRDMGGDPYPVEYQNFTRSVTVEATSESVPGLGAPVPGLKIRVEVKDSRGRMWELTRSVPEPVGT